MFFRANELFLFQAFQIRLGPRELWRRENKHNAPHTSLTTLFSLAPPVGTNMVYNETLAPSGKEEEEAPTADDLARDDDDAEDETKSLTSSEKEELFVLCTAVNAATASSSNPSSANARTWRGSKPRRLPRRRGRSPRLRSRSSTTCATSCSAWK